MHGVVLSTALRALLAAALAAAPHHFASLVDPSVAPKPGDGYQIYAVTASTHALCSVCKVDVERYASHGVTTQWLVRIDLLDVHSGTTASVFDALRDMVAPSLARGYRVSRHFVECDGATQGIAWEGPHVSVQATAGNDPPTDGIAREVLVTVP